MEIKSLIIKLNMMIDVIKENKNKIIYCSEATILDIVYFLGVFVQPYELLNSDGKQIYDWFYEKEKKSTVDISSENFNSLMISELFDVIHSVGIVETIDREKFKRILLEKYCVEDNSCTDVFIQRVNFILDFIYQEKNDFEKYGEDNKIIDVKRLLKGEMEK